MSGDVPLRSSPARVDARAHAVVAAAPAHQRHTVEARVATWRSRFSAPLVEAVFTQAAQQLETLPPKSALATALDYLLNQRAPPRRCVTTPGAVLDNNGAENALRPLKLGAKNWLFIGHPNAGPRLAHLFTLVENAPQARVDIEAYLIDLVSRLPASSIKRLSDWLPRAWHQLASSGSRPPNRCRLLQARAPRVGPARVSCLVRRANRDCQQQTLLGGTSRLSSRNKLATLTNEPYGPIRHLITARARTRMVGRTRIRGWRRKPSETFTAFVR